MFNFKPTAHDFKFTPRLNRRFYIQYSTPNLTLNRKRLGWFSMTIHIIKHTLKWWFK